MKEKVLNIFKRNGNKKLDPIEIVKYLSKDYDVKDIKEVMDVIYELVSDGSIVSCKKGMFKLTGDEYVKGKVERVSSGNGYLLQSDGDIYIDKKNMNTALTGDLCLCEIFKRFGSTEAKVKKVLDRNLPLGEIVEDSGIVYVKPLKEYPYELELLYNKEFSLVDGEIVKLKCVLENNKVLKVKVIKKIGHKNSPDIDTLKIMAELDVPAGFSEGTMNEVKSLPTEVLENDYKGRTDISNEMIFTIDGKDTKDIDDAVGLKMLDNGNYLLNVSIADVTNYVKWNSSIFNDAYNKGNSTYMADKVEPMLPIELSNGICSLNPNVLRCAVTTEIEFDTNGNVVNKRMYPSIIKSRKKMNYDDVNIILKGGHVSGYEEFESTLLNMLELSKKLKKKKLERGEIEFPSDEIKLIVDENGKVIDIKKRVQDLGENLIEEFMIASNEASIDLLTNECEYGIYRVHAKPAPKKIEDFVKFMSSLGYSTKGKFNYSDISNKNIQMILNEIKGVKDEDILSRKLLRSMQKAVYSTDNIGHFGLGSKKYTHETSPIRRFSDLLLHYMIKIVLFKWNMGVSINEIGRGLVEACDHISMTERRSDECEYAVEDMKMAEYMEGHIGEEYDAIVDTLLKNGFFVETSNYVEGFVSLDTINDYYTLNDEMTYYFDRKKRIALRLGDKVRVKCIAANKETRHIDFILVDKSKEDK
jgi:ribonuclease R